MNTEPNTLIEQIFTNFKVNNVTIPVSFLRYEGKSETYITYQQTFANDPFSADDELQNYIDFYDFDIYSKGNYLPIVEAVKTLLKANGFRWHPEHSSGDYFEDDTKYYHKTLSFSIERSI